MSNKSVTLPVAVFVALRDALALTADWPPTVKVTFGTKRFEPFSMFFNGVSVNAFVYPELHERGKNALVDLNKKDISLDSFRRSLKTIQPAQGELSVTIRSKSEIYANIINVINDMIHVQASKAVKF